MVVNRVETACIGGHITLLNVSSLLGYWFWLRNGFRFPSTGKQVVLKSRQTLDEILSQEERTKEKRSER